MGTTGSCPGSEGSPPAPPGERIPDGPAEGVCAPGGCPVDYEQVQEQHEDAHAGISVRKTFKMSIFTAARADPAGGFWWERLLHPWVGMFVKG